MGKLSRQEVAVLLYSCANRLGMNNNITSSESNLYLPAYLDFVDIPNWSKDALVFALKSDMIDRSRRELKPSEIVTRGEIADMVYRWLVAAGL